MSAAQVSEPPNRKMPDLDRVDWSRLICDCCDEGYPISDQSDATGIPRSTLERWKNEAVRSGKRQIEPKHSGGERLIAFWCAIFLKTRVDLPLIERRRAPR